MMLLLLWMLSVWNLGAILIVASRVRKLNGHHHGGPTRGAEMGFKE